MKRPDLDHLPVVRGVNWIHPLGPPGSALSNWCSGAIVTAGSRQLAHQGDSFGGALKSSHGCGKCCRVVTLRGSPRTLNGRRPRGSSGRRIHTGPSSRGVDYRVMRVVGPGSSFSLHEGSFAASCPLPFGSVRARRGPPPSADEEDQFASPAVQSDRREEKNHLHLNDIATDWVDAHCCADP